MFTKGFLQQIEVFFQKKLEQVGDKKAEIEALLVHCTEDEAEALKCLYASMPINDVTDYKGFDVNIDYHNDSTLRIDFSSLTSEQQNIVLNCIANVKDYIIPYQTIVDAIDISTAEICDEISEANDYVNNKFPN